MFRWWIQGRPPRERKAFLAWRTGSFVVGVCSDKLNLRTKLTDQHWFGLVAYDLAHLNTSATRCNFGSYKLWADTATTVYHSHVKLFKTPEGRHCGSEGVALPALCPNPTLRS